MRSYRLLRLVGLAAASACGNPAGPAEQPPEQFGSITAVVDGRTWISTQPNRQVLAVYDPQLGRLEIGATRVDGTTFESIDFSFAWSPATATYAFTPGAARVTGSWQLTTTGNASWRPSPYRLYLPTGVASDFLQLDEVDVAGGRIRGSFRVSFIEAGGSWEFLAVGRFAGALGLGYVYP